MPERPLILFGNPSMLEKEKQHGGAPKFYKPVYDRQMARIAPKFETLQNALDHGNVRMTTTANAVDPEYTLVFETIGEPSRFSNAINKLKQQYPDIEWLMELSDSCPNSDDFYVINNRGERDDSKELTTKIFCIMTNRGALSQILSLWNHYRDDPNYSFPHGLSGFKHLFDTLNDIHHWGTQERLHDTGLLDAWREDLVDTGLETLTAQIELFFRSSADNRNTAEQHLRDLITINGGSVGYRQELCAN